MQYPDFCGVDYRGCRPTQPFPVLPGMLIKINDKSRSSMERLTAAPYGKTGVDKLIAERDRLIKKLGYEQCMVDRVRAAYEKMIAVEEKKNGGGAEAFGKQIEQMIRDPLNGAKEAALGRSKGSARWARPGGRRRAPQRHCRSRVGGRQEFQRVRHAHPRCRDAHRTGGQPRTHPERPSAILIEGGEMSADLLADGQCSQQAGRFVATNGQTAWNRRSSQQRHLGRRAGSMEILSRERREEVRGIPFS